MTDITTPPIGLVWYALRSDARSEQRVTEGLIERGFAVYLPLETRWHRTRKGRSPKDRALIPGYLFVGLAPGQSVYGALQVDGARSVIGVAGQARAIDPGFIYELQLRQEAGEFDQTAAKRFKLKVGDSARILHGPFRDQIGQLMSVGEDGRIKLLLSGLFAGGIALDSDAVEAVEGKARAA